MMESEEWLQLLGIAVAVAIPVALIVRWVRKLNAIFPDVARIYGLLYTQDKERDLLGNVKQAQKLSGSVQGLPLQVAATYETRGRLRIKGTWVATRAPAGLPPCTLNLQRTRPAQDLHLVKTGDAAFDARWYLSTDTPQAVAALIHQTAHAELRECTLSELRVVVDGPHLVLSFPGTPSSRDELHAPIKIALAMAKAGAA